MERRLRTFWIASLWVTVLLSCASHSQGFNQKFSFDPPIESEVKKLSVDSETDHAVFKTDEPFRIYEQSFNEFTIHRNGWIALDNKSADNLPLSYPKGLKENLQRLHDIEGNFFAAFSYPNSASTGSVKISYVNLSTINCVMEKHWERVTNIVRVSYPEEKEFYPKAALIVAWINMTEENSDDQKRNSFAVMMLTDGESSYVLVQYRNMLWPEVSTESLAPEAGIFMESNDGYQLPRSGHFVDPSLWNNESNIASAGEWLIPLKTVRLNPDSQIESLKEITINYTQSLNTDCKSQPDTLESASTTVMNKILSVDDDSVKSSIEPDHETNERFQDELEEPVLPQTDDQYEDYEEYTTTEEPIETQAPYPSNEAEGNEGPFVQPLERSIYGSNNQAHEAGPMCDARTKCNASNTDCYVVEGGSCCVCQKGFFGNGKKECWSESAESKFSFIGDGHAKFGSMVSTLNLSIYLDIQLGRNKMSSSGLRGGSTSESSYRTMRLVTPMLHVLNALIGSTCPENLNQAKSENRPYSIFTLAGGLVVPFSMQFYFDVEGMGRLASTVRFEGSNKSHGPYSTYSISIEISNSGPFAMLQKSFFEVPATELTEDVKSYYATYYVDAHGRIVFPEQSVLFKADNSPDEKLTVRWSGIADIPSFGDQDLNAACLLKPGSPVPRDQSYYIRLGGRGYCSEDCSAADGSCNLFCVDEPLIFAHKPDACDCVQCEREGEVCIAEGAVYTCPCKPGLTRMEDHTCRADGPFQARTTRMGCGPVDCHPDARCIDPSQGFCQCIPGFRGDGIVRCDDDPCSRCRRNEVCIDNVCQPSGVNLCEGVRCGEQAFCQDGACICNPGYTGDPMVRCVEERELCAGVKCHEFGQCHENRCYCQYGYRGDGVNFCTVHTEDPCQGVRCAANARCTDGQCICEPGYEGNGASECRPVLDRCADVQCGAYSQCYDGYCRCLDGYEQDSYGQCRPRPEAPCVDAHCSPYARCVGGQCKCNDGYEGDGYACRESVVQPDQCGECQGRPYPEMALCVAGRCVCAPGFNQYNDHTCLECVHSDCHKDATCSPNSQYNGAYSCQCKPGFIGDGVKECRPDGGGGSIVDPQCGGGCNLPNSVCMPQSGRCVCREGYEGDGSTYCVWSCQNCPPDSDCDQANERCVCRPGYYFDGMKQCIKIPIEPEPVTVQIDGEGQVLRVTELNQPLELRCTITTKDESITGQWIQPISSQTAEISIARLATGKILTLKIPQPALSDAGRYNCRAADAEAFIDVMFEETALPYDIFLTSDDGILKVDSGSKNVTTAMLWNIAENNKYARVSMVTDCNSKRIVYTSDYGKSIRGGDGEATQKSLTTSQIFSSQLSRFSSLAVDPSSGNIYAWDEAFGKIVIVNPAKPQMRHTIEHLYKSSDTGNVRFAGMAVHPTQGLLYWATFSDGWMPNGTIQVAGLDGTNEAQLVQLNGEPLSLSLAPLVESGDASVGRLCWMQRSITSMATVTTELHCARLSADGRQVLVRERLRQFSRAEEPSWGMTHHRGTVLWVDSSRTIYYSANPDRRVRVKHVCCSNRFQSIAVMAKCHTAFTNPCSFSNGGCRYFCLPGEKNRMRTCLCPDNVPGCHKEM